jgi:Spy/CpxP family protein refolding chaperone
MTMLNKSKLIIAAALLSVASSVMAAQAQTHVNRSGDVIDSQGWRLSDGNWDNTCFRTLDYLSSMSACSGGGGN